jgi:UPF0716 protein FxsA
MLVALLFLALIGVPLLEIYVVIEVGRAIGVPATLALLILDALLGTILMRSQGRAVWRRARETLRAGRVPGREALDGALVIVGGALLIAPGFITDALGALLLLPLTRRPIGRMAVRRLTRSGSHSSAQGQWHDDPARRGGTSSGRPHRPGGSHGPAGYDVDGDASEIVDPGRLSH